MSSKDTAFAKKKMFSAFCTTDSDSKVYLNPYPDANLISLNETQGCSTICSTSACIVSGTKALALASMKGIAIIRAEDVR